MRSSAGPGLHRGHSASRTPSGPRSTATRPSPAHREAPGGRRSGPVPAGAGVAPTGSRSGTSTTATSCSTSWPGSKHPRAGRPAGPRVRTTSCARRSGRWCSTCPQMPPSSDVDAAASSCTGRYRPRSTAPTTSAYADATDVPAYARRGSRPSSWCPGVGMFSFGRGQADGPGGRRVLRQRHQRHAGGGGALGLRADRRERRSSGSSTGSSRRPKLRRQPRAKPLARRPGGLRHRRRLSGIGRGHRAARLAAEGACVVVADLDAREAARAATEHRQARRRRRLSRPTSTDESGRAGRDRRPPCSPSVGSISS